MNEAKAREILVKRIDADNSLSGGYDYADWSSDQGSESITLDGIFLADELEAIVWWMRNKKVEIKKERKL